MSSTSDKCHRRQVDRQSETSANVREQPPELCPACGDVLNTVDAYLGDDFRSHTLRCETCGECYLHVRHGQRTALIHLQDFLERRGGAPEKRPLYERKMARALVTAMLSDDWPSPATCADFGLDTDDRYRAMQKAVKAGLTAYELDRVLGDGQAITQLITFAHNDSRHCRIQFSTPYDDLPTDPAQHDHPRPHRKLTTKQHPDI